MPIFNMISGGGGTGGTLTVTAPANTTVTISNGDKTKSKTSDANGTAIFKGLETGTWTVTITNSTQTTTKTVDITADYAMTIAFFAATIAVTYPEGSTCTCTDGSTTFTAPDTTGSYTFTVPNTGTWTVSCTDGTDATSNSVSITEDGVSVSVTLTYFDGYLFKDGEWSDYACPNGITGGYNVSHVSIATKNGVKGMKLRSQCQVYSSDAFNVSGYSKLNATIFYIYDAKCTLGLATAIDDTSVVASTTGSSAKTISVDISAITGECYLMLKSISSDTSDGQGTYISDIWLS